MNEGLVPYSVSSYEGRYMAGLDEVDTISICSSLDFEGNKCLPCGVSPLPCVPCS